MIAKHISFARRVRRIAKNHIICCTPIYDALEI